MADNDVLVHDDACTEIVVGETRIAVAARFLPDEERFDPEREARAVQHATEAQRELVAAGRLRAWVPEAPGGVSLEVRWLREKWDAARDNWWLFGERLLECLHVAEHEPSTECWWFIRYPDAMLCAACGERLWQAMKSAPMQCDYCGDTQPGMYAAQTADGMTVRAAYILCLVCRGY